MKVLVTGGVDLLSGKKLEIQYTAAKKGDVKYSQADISLAKK